MARTAAASSVATATVPMGTSRPPRGLRHQRLFPRRTRTLLGRHKQESRRRRAGLRSTRHSRHLRNLRRRVRSLAFVHRQALRHRSSRRLPPTPTSLLACSSLSFTGLSWASRSGSSESWSGTAWKVGRLFMRHQGCGGSWASLRLGTASAFRVPQAGRVLVLVLVLVRVRVLLGKKPCRRFHSASPRGWRRARRTGASLAHVEDGDVTDARAGTGISGRLSTRVCGC